MKNKKKTLLLFLLAALLAVICVGVGVLLGKKGGPPAAEEPSKQELDAGASDWTGEKEVYTGEKNTGTIDIPGYGSITLKAGETSQAVNFHNPEQNTCYFRMSLLLSDGTQLWQSGLVGPGKGVYEIELNKALEAGTYEGAVLKYECFAMDEAQTPLNGSEITLTINVLE